MLLPAALTTTGGVAVVELEPEGVDVAPPTTVGAVLVAPTVGLSSVLLDHAGAVGAAMVVLDAAVADATLTIEAVWYADAVT